MESLAGYIVQSVLGKGGMATVYLAARPGGAPVALKVLHSELSGDEVVVERFLRECSALSQLSHPNILRILDSGEESGVFYYAMETIQAPTVYRLMVDSGYPASVLPLSRSLGIAADMLAALAYCHARHVLHRDVKPSNIFVVPGRGAVLADFGLALMADMRRLTVKGSFLGTELYASPEQLLGRDVDATSDLYQLGLILYQLVAGRLPFPNSWKTIWQVKCESPQVLSPRDINRLVPLEVEAALARALARERERRFASADEFRTVVVDLMRLDAVL
jgi:serine/threonine-protein kinase